MLSNGGDNDGDKLLFKHSNMYLIYGLGLRKLIQVSPEIRLYLGPKECRKARRKSKKSCVEYL